MNIQHGEHFYHARREAEELLAALQTDDRRARASHAKLALLHRRAAAERWR